jgi:hypothetical protein
MKDQEQWEELCRQASIEQDPRKLLQLITEINRLLTEKQSRIGQAPKTEEAKQSPGDEG